MNAMTAQAAADHDDDQNTAAFAFVQSLATELSEGDIDLPSFPDVAVGADGRFMVVWEDASQPGDDDKAIVARAFEAASSVGGAGQA